MNDDILRTPYLGTDSLRSEYTDAVYVTKDANGKVKSHQTHHTTTKATLGGVAAGLVIGSIPLILLSGAVLGAAGAWAGRQSDEDLLM
jgi:uncharacterized membrane protein